MILEKGEQADELYGLCEDDITDEDIEALKQGKRLYFTFNEEYALVLKYKKK